MRKLIATAAMVVGLMGGVAKADGFGFSFGGHRSGGYVQFGDGSGSYGGYSGGYYGGCGTTYSGYSDCYRPPVPCGHWEDRGYWQNVWVGDCSCGHYERNWVSVRVWVND